MPTIHAPLNSWCSGKTEYLSCIEQTKRLTVSCIQEDDELYVVYFADGTLFIFEHPSVVQTFFDKYGSRKFDDSNERATLANEVWSDYLIKCINSVDGEVKDVWCDFHPFSGTRYQQLIRGEWSDQVYHLNGMKIEEYALVNWNTLHPEYYSAEFKTRSIENRGCEDVDAESSIPLTINANIPRYFHAKNPYYSWSFKFA